MGYVLPKANITNKTGQFQTFLWRGEILVTIDEIFDALKIRDHILDNEEKARKNISNFKALLSFFNL